MTQSYMYIHVYKKESNLFTYKMITIFVHALVEYVFNTITLCKHIYMQLRVIVYNNEYVIVHNNSQLHIYMSTK